MIVIQKFGGTSVNDITKLHLVLEHVQLELNKGNKVICVVSAMGRSNCYSTNTLIDLIQNNIPKKDQDRLLSVGEIISSIVIGDFLNTNGIDCKIIDSKDLGIITDSNYTNANIIDVRVNYIKEQLNNCGCVIVPGFQGIDQLGYTTTLGRGGSDTTALALASKINNCRVEIISDVDGIYSADPKIIKNAIKYKQINYSNLLKITNNGSKVFHVKAAQTTKLHTLNVRFMKLGNYNDYTLVKKCENNDFKCICYKENDSIDNKSDFVRVAYVTNETTNVKFVKKDKFINYINDIHKKLIEKDNL